MINEEMHRKNMSLDMLNPEHIAGLFDPAENTQPMRLHSDHGDHVDNRDTHDDHVDTLNGNGGHSDTINPGC
jgi:hypothetical protein